MRRGASPTPAAQRGVALILIMWLIALLAGIVGAFAWATQSERLAERGLSRGLAAQQAARAGIEYAIVQVQRNDRRRWAPDGRDYRWAFGSARLEIAIDDESGKVDLNMADHGLLSRLLIECDTPRDIAERLAGAIIDWRDPDSLTQVAGGAEDGDYASSELPYGAKDAVFSTVAEVEQVLGMTPRLYAKCAPFLTIYGGRATPDPRMAKAEVLRAMQLDPERQPGHGTSAPPSPELVVGSGTYSIASHARMADGSQALLRVVVQPGASRLPGATYSVLRWEEGAMPR